MPPDRRDPATGKPTYTAGAMALIRDERGRVLWTKRRDKDRWELPGGVIEFGETPAQAAAREAREETGFDVEVLRLAVIDWKRDKGDAVLIFECRVLGGSATPSDETSEVAFFDVDAPPPGVPQRYLDRVSDIAAWPRETLLRSTE